MGRKDAKKIAKLQQERQKLEGMLAQLRQEAGQVDEQLAKVGKRNAHLHSQIHQEKEAIKGALDFENMHGTFKAIRHQGDNDSRGGDDIEDEQEELDDQVDHQEEEVVNDEIDAICLRTLDYFLEPLSKQNMTFEVEHQNKRAVFQLKNDNHTFDDIKGPISQYFALPEDKIFFKLKDKDEVLLFNLPVKPTLFPMISTKIRHEIPCLRIAMQANMSTLDFILGEEQIKGFQQQEAEAQWAAHQQAIKVQIQREEAKKKETELNRVRSQIQKRQNCLKIVIGLAQTCIFVLFSVFFVLLIISQRQVVSSFFFQYGTQDHLFNVATGDIQFSNMDQMYHYITNNLGKGLWQDQELYDDIFWKNNILLRVLRVQQIRGMSKQCDYTGRPGFAEIYSKKQCVSPYSRFGERVKDPFQNITYKEYYNPIESRGMIDSYPVNGYFKYLRLNQSTWVETIEKEIKAKHFIDAQTLVFIMTFNLYNPSVNILQEFKLIFNFQVGGIILLEYDVITVNLKLFANDRQEFYSIMVFIIGSILLVISIIDMKRQKNQLQDSIKNLQENDQSKSQVTKPKKKVTIQEAGVIKRILSCHCCRGILNGVSVFDIINVLMITASFIDLGLKYLYDYLVWDDIKIAAKSLSESQEIELSEKRFVEFDKHYLFYESLTLLDALVIFMMALSIIKYTFFWIPSLSILTSTFQSYFNTTIKRIFYFIILISISFSIYCHLFYSYLCFGFFDFSFSMIRTNLLFIQGSLFNKNKFYLSEESMEYVYSRIGWIAALFNMGIIHFFGKYFIITLIVSFMKRDIAEAIQKSKKRLMQERNQAELQAINKLANNNN